MVSDRQVRRLMSLMEKEKYLYQAADKAGMNEKTARKYRNIKKLPSQIKSEHTWQTREDPFEEDWAYIAELLEVNPALEGKTIFDHLQERAQQQGEQEEVKYKPGQLRTLQRRIKRWRATEGPGKEVYFPQVHHPGDLCASDFTNMNALGITIQGEPLKHLLYHCVLTYSNWESCLICYSESFSSISAGLQDALWKMGAVPRRHRSDRMSAAVNKECNPEEFTRHYQALMRHYGIKPEKTNVRCAHENGDVESSHKGFKNVVRQAIMLRGSNDFRSLSEYKAFLEILTRKKNALRKERFEEEIACMHALPAYRLNDFKTITTTVRPSSTIVVDQNVYSVHSRLIRERVTVRVYAEHIEVWYAQKKVEAIPRLLGRCKRRIQYRHVIDWLIKKPGAFADYRYKDEMFPSSWFRMAYDWLTEHLPHRANKEYVHILALAAWESESLTERAIQHKLERNESITVEALTPYVFNQQEIPCSTQVTIMETSLATYDSLITEVASYA